MAEGDRSLDAAERQPVSLIQLQQALEIPLVEVWLGLLVGEHEQYQWETSGEFCSDAQDIWLFAPSFLS